MGGSNSTVSLTLQIKGQQAAQELKRISDQQIQATTKINTQWTQIGSAQAKFVNIAKVGTRETLNTARAGDQLLRTNRMLEGVLRQQSIQTKLQSQLLKQQVSSAQQLVSSAKQVEQSSKRTYQSTQQTMSLWQKGIAIGGAVVGAGFALQQPIKRTVDYDRDLHYAAQTFADRPEDWGPAKQWINKIVTGNAINGGVKRDDAFLAMEALIADGSYSQGSDLNKNKAALAKAHFDAARAALASGGDMLDFANVGLTARKRGLDEKLVQAMVIQGDAEGSMRAKDLAKVINPQLGLLPKDPANNARSVAQLVALNEVAMTTAGDANDAGTNVKNLISKLSSSDTTNRLAKEYDIDLTKRTALDKGKGKTSLDTFLDITEEIISKNPEMRRVKANLAKAKNSQETQAIWESQKGVFEQSGLAGIMPDMQSLLALVAATNNRKLMDQITQNAMNKGIGTLDLKANYNKTQLASVGLNAFDVTRQNAEYQTLQDSTKLLGEMGQKVAEVTEKYPKLITAMGTTELALKALAFTAGGAALAQMAANKKVDLPNLPTSTKGVATKAVGGASALGGVAAAYAGSQLIKPIDDAGYNFVSGLLAKIGIGSGGERPDFVQQAIEQGKAQQASAEEKSSQLIAEQQKQNQLSQEMINRINALINVTGQNKPMVFNGGGSLLDAISHNAATQEARHGAPPYYLMKR
ncbi:hypothetical protein BFR69_00685 [Acinetobacter pittii]|uniref:hypothetical protein n=1 Tax=Acinetobacter pittii TaxID=48296 RepID=UPI00029DEF6B|nr:hypothetical protein [Acinetobacter pittii]EKU67607.1 hypothetical protein ACINWC136_3249 [Acinetobacter pittii]KRI14798.1 hypothetical protein APC96_12295 [Acinetobacter pittii]KRJ07995.1 hypothetical protein APC76_06370 [Acinetobacter pittii]OCY18622.1 hypothetical protein BFR64_15970 [Acinetobacter pittii]OCY27677.1 hypothetical protein BFR74_15225 [Acinetobacter pittii]